MNILQLNKFENKSSDQAIISCGNKKYKNYSRNVTLYVEKYIFSCDVIGSKGQHT